MAHRIEQAPRAAATASRPRRRRTGCRAARLAIYLFWFSLLTVPVWPSDQPSPRVASGDEHGVPLENLKRLFARPAPAAQTNPASYRLRIALGEQLFHEKRLSRNGTVACATCHDRDRAFTDRRQISRGISGVALARNAPSLLDVRHSKALFWDGRTSDLEAQARVPLEHPDEMGLPLASAIARLNAQPSYRTAFGKAFPAKPQIDGGNMLAAIAAYERSLTSPNTRFDRWIAGDARALNATEQRGFRLFAGKARCLTCHGGWRFSDDRFHDIGLPSPDLGRGAVPGANGVPHSFKTPSLRETRWTAPYMHDGSLASFDDVLRHYTRDLIRRPSLAAELRPQLVLPLPEQADLIAFLRTLSSNRPQR